MASIIRYLWLGTRLTIDEVDALFALKHRKHERQRGNLIEPKDEPVRRAVLSQQPHAVLSAANGKQSQYSTPRSSSVEMEPPENELALDELVLRGNRDPLAGRHAERTGHGTGEPAEAHDRRGDAAARETEHERHIGDETVADAEHRRARETAGDRAVVLVHQVR